MPRIRNPASLLLETGRPITRPRPPDRGHNHGQADQPDRGHPDSWPQTAGGAERTTPWPTATHRYLPGGHPQIRSWPRRAPADGHLDARVATPTGCSAATDYGYRGTLTARRLIDRPRGPPYPTTSASVSTHGVRTPAGGAPTPTAKPIPQPSSVGSLRRSFELPARRYPITPPRMNDRFRSAGVSVGMVFRGAAVR